jgi:hypothetical protein
LKYEPALQSRLRSAVRPFSDGVMWRVLDCGSVKANPTFEWDTVAGYRQKLIQF